MKTVDPVLLSVIRRAWPTIIASSLIGVQPMTGPTGQIFNMKPRYRVWNLKMCKERYKWFLRLNDRKTCHAPEEFTRAKYPLITLTSNQIARREEIYKWCDETVGEYRWCHNDYDLIAFYEDQYATLFKLTWSDDEMA